MFFVILYMSHCVPRKLFSLVCRQKCVMIGWSLFKTQNFNIFLKYIIASSKHAFENYIQCTL